MAEVRILIADEREWIRFEIGMPGCAGGRVARLIDGIRALFRPHAYFREWRRPRRARPPQSRGAAVNGARPLTVRQRQVLRLLAEGRTNKEIAAHLGMSVKTAEAHRAHLMARLDLHSAGALVRYAVRHHIVDA